MNENSTVTRLCIDCEKPLHGHMNKKFCNKYCRNSFNKQSSMPTKKANKKISGHVQTCPNSGKAFIQKRKNMIYASAKERRDFHNQKAAELRRLKLPIDRFLDKNFIILSDLVKEGEIKTFEKYELLLKGFNPNVFTHYAKYDGKICPCFYHFILPSKNPSKVTVIYQPIDFQEIQSSVPKSSKLGNIFKKLFKIN